MKTRIQYYWGESGRGLNYTIIITVLKEYNTTLSRTEIQAPFSQSTYSSTSTSRIADANGERE